MELPDAREEDQKYDDAGEGFEPEKNVENDRKSGQFVVLFLTSQGSRSAERKNSPEREENRGNKVFVGNLSFKTSWQKLKDYMRDVGEVIRVHIFEDRNRRSKGCGYVSSVLKSDLKVWLSLRLEKRL